VYSDTPGTANASTTISAKPVPAMTATIGHTRRAPTSMTIRSAMAPPCS
jgi:hypothetical protein